MEGAAMINYIGLDAHSTTCTFVNLNEAGKVMNSAQIPTTEKYLTSFLSSIKGKKVLTLEESSLAKWLYVVIKPMVDELIVCAPQFLSKKQRAKTDLRDARHLANELRLNNLVSVFHDENNYLIELRSLIASYQNIVDEVVRCKSRLKSVFRSQAIVFKGRSLYTSPEEIKMLGNEVDRFNADALFYHLYNLEEIKQNYLAYFEQNMKKYPILQKLATIPGVSTVRSHVIAAITCDAKRFKNKHHYWSYCMLVRHKQISNGTVYGLKRAIGRSELKSVFMSCATTQLKGESQFRKYYDRLRSKGVGDREAQKAMARKSAAIALSIMRTGKRYNDNWSKVEEKMNIKN